MTFWEVKCAQIVPKCGSIELSDYMNKKSLRQVSDICIFFVQSRMSDL